MRLKHLGLALLLIGAAGATSPAFAQNSTATVTASLNARSGPSTAYGVLFVMPAGASVGVLDCTAARTWCQVSYTGRVGWASARYLSFGGAVSGDPDPVVVTPGGGVSARVTASLNMRRGPSTAYGTIIAIPAGATVRVNQCIEGYAWCEATYAGYTGWVSARYLQYGQQSFTIAAPRLGIRLTINFGGGQQPLPPPTQQARACFYADFNYTGPSFCLNRGQDLSALDPNWNDRISSIRVEGGASVIVCEDFGFGGQCLQYNQNVAQLSNFNDRISAIQVR
ncbi:MAG: SH3 domain-containing protein [Bauldia sp.]